MQLPVYPHSTALRIEHWGRESGRVPTASLGFLQLPTGLLPVRPGLWMSTQPGYCNYLTNAHSGKLKGTKDGKQQSCPQNRSTKSICILDSVKHGSFVTLCKSLSWISAANEKKNPRLAGRASQLGGSMTLFAPNDHTMLLDYLVTS